jgi:hypothetical protein
MGVTRANLILQCFIYLLSITELFAGIASKIWRRRGLSARRFSKCSWLEGKSTAPYGYKQLRNKSSNVADRRVTNGNRRSKSTLNGRGGAITALGEGYMKAGIGLLLIYLCFLGLPNVFRRN